RILGFAGDCSALGEITMSLTIETGSIMERIVIGLLDDSRENGIGIGFFPATGEVCDLCNDGGVIGYLPNAPYRAGDAVKFEITVNRYGANFVTALKLNGESFLYPGFLQEGEINLSAVVGKNVENADMWWSNLELVTSDENAFLAA
ncbi:MAG: hypothetical protein AAF226_08405, partial [Verrucomicrobiota bacterium]